MVDALRADWSTHPRTVTVPAPDGGQVTIRMDGDRFMQTLWLALPNNGAYPFIAATVASRNASLIAAYLALTQSRAIATRPEPTPGRADDRLEMPDAAIHRVPLPWPPTRVLSAVGNPHRPRRVAALHAMEDRRSTRPQRTDRECHAGADHSRRSPARRRKHRPAARIALRFATHGDRQPSIRRLDRDGPPVFLNSDAHS